MAIYNHILVALDLSEDCANVARKAKALAECYGAKLSVTHVVEPLVFAYGGDVSIGLNEAQKIVEEQATIRLEKLLNKEDIAAEHSLVAVGQTSSEIHRAARDYDADLISHPTLPSAHRHPLTIDAFHPRQRVEPEQHRALADKNRHGYRVGSRLVNRHRGFRIRAAAPYCDTVNSMTYFIPITALSQPIGIAADVFANLAFTLEDQT